MDSQMSADTAPQKFFISYARRDAASVELRTYLAEKLRQPRYEVFTDQCIEGSQEWVKEIEQHAKSCDCFVVLICEAAIASDWVREEVRLTYERPVRPRTFVVRLDAAELDPQLN